MTTNSTLLLCIGNTSLFGGVWGRGAKVRWVFRVPLADGVAGVAQEIGAEVKIARAVVCSVVPQKTEATLRAIKRTWGAEVAVLTADGLHGLRIGYREPRRLGADRLAAAIGARALFPRHDVIVVDCGTATTVTALTREGVLAGGAIFPGVGLWPQMLAQRTAQLPEVPLGRPRRALGRAPEEGIASGIFFGHAGAIREVVARVGREAFGSTRAQRALIVGTGGHASWFARENLFTAREPNLILHGLRDYAARIF